MLAADAYPGARELIFPYSKESSACQNSAAEYRKSHIGAIALQEVS